MISPNENRTNSKDRPDSSTRDMVSTPPPASAAPNEGLPAEDTPESFNMSGNFEWGALMDRAHPWPDLPDFIHESPSASQAVEAPSDFDSIRSLYCDVARHHCEPLTPLLLSVQQGECSDETLDALQGIFEKLLLSAREVEFQNLTEALAPILALLDHIISHNAADNPQEQLAMVREYGTLAERFPDIFEPLKSETAERRLAYSIIVMEELRSIRGLGKVRNRNLFAAGISRLEIFCSATERDLQAVSGMTPPLAAQVAAAFVPYRALLEGDSTAIASLHQNATKQLTFQILDLEQCLQELGEIRNRNRYKIFVSTAEEAQLLRIRERTFGAIRKNLAILNRLGDIESFAGKRYDERVQMLWRIMENIENRPEAS